jgi:hypothetical protein
MIRKGEGTSGEMRKWEMMEDKRNPRDVCI